MDRCQCERYLVKAIVALKDAHYALGGVDVDEGHQLFSPLMNALQSIDAIEADLKRWNKILHDEEIELEG